MMEYTDCHFRQLARLMSHHTWLYTEMVVDNMLLHQQPKLDKWLEFPSCQHPLVAQVGGSDPQLLAQAARLIAAYGYDEINLNCGCPSSAVAGHGCFGARLMLDPERVGTAMASMALAIGDIPVTIKCRIGVDDVDSYEELCTFVETVAKLSPVDHFVIHSRKAILKGLSPAQNRSVPPLKYEYVLALVRDFPSLTFTLNGGIVSLAQAAQALEWGVHGVMIGRAAYSSPWAILGDADRVIYGVPNCATSRREVLEQYVEYADRAKGRYGEHRPSLRNLVMPLLGLFHGEHGGANWRRAIEGALRSAQTVQEIVQLALPALPVEILDAGPGEGKQLGVAAGTGIGARLPPLGDLPPPPAARITTQDSNQCYLGEPIAVQPGAAAVGLWCAQSAEKVPQEAVA
eukprot:TRINITY_DN1697_c0_g7_i1.p1 TRINITY_DN1697_c0_g7~~TRINITY_DN1697_c0_g7_i1.p1  ORF type:complete len:402 (-),score=59.26 TRINITY_DN1697_c0_g7_i1:634-1839(-)